jgi:hypothetical protein
LDASATSTRNTNT